MATDMTTDVQQWWAGLLAYLGDQASALREAGWNYESAVWHRGQVGLNETWPILALRMLDEGYPAARQRHLTSVNSRCEYP
jgi:hypothetical protein